MQALNADIATHQETIQAQTAKTNRLQQQLTEAQQLSTQLDASLSATKAELRTSRDKVASLEEASKKLSEEVEAGLQLSVEVVSLKSELDSAQRRQQEQQLALRSKLNKFGLQVSYPQIPYIHSRITAGMPSIFTNFFFISCDML